MEARPGLEPRLRDLRSLASPLRHRATLKDRPGQPDEAFGKLFQFCSIPGAKPRPPLKRAHHATHPFGEGALGALGGRLGVAPILVLTHTVCSHAPPFAAPKDSRPEPAARRLTVRVGQDRYSARMNTPRHSRHDVVFAPLLPTHQIWKRIEAVTLLAPSLKGDLVHAYNRIPLGPTPFVVGFESHLPRYWWSNTDAMASGLRRLLASDRCRAIVASSHAAARIFETQHAGSHHLATLRSKLCVFDPNFDLPPLEAIEEGRGPSRAELHVAFVGAHFGRKGGAVGVRLAELARRQGAPIHVTIVSRLETGKGVWSDPSRPGFFDPYTALLDAPNVTFIRGAQNAEVLALLRRADFTLLTTLSDTFGWSVVESMANATPVIVTPQGALGEFVMDGVNGIVTPLAVDELREWVHIHDDKSTPAFERVYRDEVERLAETTLARLAPLIGDTGALSRLRAGARDTAERLFCARKASVLWDDLYEDALSVTRGARARAAMSAHMAGHGLRVGG